jgi:hypothetical protein
METIDSPLPRRRAGEQEEVRMDELSQIDLAFCVDLTSSMTPFIAAARAHMRDILNGLTAGADVDLRVALVGYRDYGTRTRLVEVYPFHPGADEVRKVLDRLKVVSPPENTDAAEAVFAGLSACLGELRWRPGAVKVALLVGDAPPHGCGADGGPCPDRYPKGDPSGQTLMGMSSAVEGAGVALHALGMLPSVAPMYDAVTEKSFAWLARTTAGTYRPARSSKDALAVVEVIGKRVFGELDFDRRLWARLAVPGKQGLPAAERVEELLPELQRALGATAYEIHASVERLRRRLARGHPV